MGKKLWLKLLANRFPHLEFVEDATIRTLLDSHRNQGIMNVLMTVSGSFKNMLFIVIKQSVKYFIKLILIFQSLRSLSTSSN